MAPLLARVALLLTRCPRAAVTQRGEKDTVAFPSRSSHGRLCPSPFSLRQSRGCPAGPALCGSPRAFVLLARPSPARVIPCQAAAGGWGRSVRRLPGALRLPGHLRVNERQAAASGSHGHGGEITQRPEAARGSGRAVAFRAAGQSAQISLICVTQ